MSISRLLEEQKNIYKNFFPPDIKLLEKSFLSKKFNYCIPIGFNCNSASCLQESKNRIRKLPFDWMQASLDNYKKMIVDTFNNNLELEISKHPRWKCQITKYLAGVPHEPDSNNLVEIKTNYIKYFKRLKKILEHPNKKDKFDICIVITSFSIKNINIVNEYKNLLTELFPNNNYYFLTVNIGDKPFIKDNHINIINYRLEGGYNNGEWIGNIYNLPLFSFFSKYLNSINSGVDLDELDNE